MDTYTRLSGLLHELFLYFQKIPGSAIVLRYVRSSYQNDPVRSAVELFLFLFFIRYLLAPKYSTQNKGYVALSDDVRAFFV
jgi:serine palmitoyltransferase